MKGLLSRLVRGLASLLVLIAVLAGAPWLLLTVGRFDLATTIDWTHLFSTTDGGQLLLLVLTGLAWASWAYVALTVVSELVFMLSQARVRIPVPGSTWLRPAVGVLVASVIGLVVAHVARSGVGGASTGAPAPGAGVSASASPTRTPNGPVSTGPGQNGPGQTGPGQAGPGEGAPRDQTRQGAPRPDTQTHRADAASGLYVVQTHDDLWDLAGRLYGDPTRWRELASANHLGSDATLHPGVTLQIPGLSQQQITQRTGQAAPDTSTRSIVVHPGDSLWSLSETHLGSGAYWYALWQANPTLVVNPDLIEPGWVLHLPPRTGAPNSSTSATSARPPSTASAESKPTSTTSAAAKSIPQVPRAHPPSTAASPSAGTSTPTVSTSPQATPTAAQTDAHSSAADGQIAAAALAGVGALCAVGLAFALRARRRQQSFSRPVGRRFRHPDADAQRFDAALRRAAAAHPDAEDASDAVPIPTTDPGPTAVVVGETESRSVLVDLADAGMLTIAGASDLVGPAGAALVVSLSSAPWSAGVETHLASPRLGWLAELDDPNLTVVDQLDEGLAQLRRALTYRAAHRPETSDDGVLDGEAAHDLAVWVIDVAGEPADRQAGLISGTGAQLLGIDVGISVVWLTDLQPARVRTVLTNLADDGVADGGDLLELRSDQVAELTGVPETFVPNLVTEPARRAIVELFSLAATTHTERAPWWVPDSDPYDSHPASRASGQPADAAWNVKPPTSSAAPTLGVLSALPEPAAALARVTATDGRLALRRRPDTEHPEETVARIPDVLARPAHPTLMLLGPVMLNGARGRTPERSIKQCQEYCAWLMDHPHQTAVAMSRALLVAESTRRSTMSRLRAWLGTTPEGDEYLPDAYSGRIQLHSGVTSDWEYLQLLVSAGVNRASDDALVEALELVRGAPLADAAPGQWHWAEEMRSDMVATVRDIGVVLASRAVAARDSELARWAASRALVAAPEDEQLLSARIRTEHAAGNRPEVERLVLHLTRSARSLGVDLGDETVALLQEVMEGRVRARA